LIPAVAGDVEPLAQDTALQARWTLFIKRSDLAKDQESKSVGGGPKWLYIGSSTMLMFNGGDGVRNIRLRISADISISREPFCAAEYGEQFSF
jgi:hypothetical protein